MGQAARLVICVKGNVGSADRTGPEADGGGGVIIVIIRELRVLKFPPSIELEGS